MQIVITANSTILFIYLFIKVLLCLLSDMAMAICDALISIEGKVVELLVKPVGRQFDYVFYRVKYIEDLREQVQNLEAQRKDVLDSINAAKRNREEILVSVKNWIDKVNGFILEAKEFLEGGTNEAKNKAEEAKELGKEGKFNNNISKPALPLGIESIPSEQFVPYASRNSTMTSVMEALIDEKINIIGIHVSQNPDIKNIQGQIASMLGFTRLIDQQSEIERASMLYARLKDVKKILNVGDVVDSNVLTVVANEVCKECGGLPIALM
ncbi:hypothetical protein CsSME_00030951 [Camellia sinensis var. sinensis]